MCRPRCCHSGLGRWLSPTPTTRSQGPTAKLEGSVRREPPSHLTLMAVWELPQTTLRFNNFTESQNSLEPVVVTVMFVIGTGYIKIGQGRDAWGREMGRALHVKLTLSGHSPSAWTCAQYRVRPARGIPGPCCLVSNGASLRRTRHSCQITLVITSSSKKLKRNKANMQTVGLINQGGRC